MASSWQKCEKLMKKEMRKIYSEAVIEHSIDLRNLGELEDANGFAGVTGPCGDTMSIWLKINGDTIINASFMTDGCDTTITSPEDWPEPAQYCTVTKENRRKPLYKILVDLRRPFEPSHPDQYRLSLPWCNLRLLILTRSRWDMEFE